MSNDFHLAILDVALKLKPLAQSVKDRPRTGNASLGDSMLRMLAESYLEVVDDVDWSDLDPIRLAGWRPASEPPECDVGFAVPVIVADRPRTVGGVRIVHGLYYLNQVDVADEDGRLTGFAAPRYEPDREWEITDDVEYWQPMPAPPDVHPPHKQAKPKPGQGRGQGVGQGRGQGVGQGRGQGG